MDRHARKKARTREKIRSIARRLFAARGFDAVTIADIAAEADVAVQTVFNHFATKEELFFDGRTPWVDGPARAVRSRPDGASPLKALREYLVAMVSALAGAHAGLDRRSFIATIEASPALKARERELVHESECRLREALGVAWSQETSADAPADPTTAAALIAATWLAITRVLLVSQRPTLESPQEAADSAAAIESLTAQLLDRLEHGTGLVHVRPFGIATSVTGWPGDVRRAG
jgi:AcrR family transcriptional regulator